jgi:hypothetical protein
MDPIAGRSWDQRQTARAARALAFSHPSLSLIGAIGGEKCASRKTRLNRHARLYWPRDEGNPAKQKHDTHPLLRNAHRPRGHRHAVSQCTEEGFGPPGPRIILAAYPMSAERGL